MFTFLRAQLSSLISSLVDFTIMVLLRELLGVWYLGASMVGTISGGVTNFCLGRLWVFQAKEESVEGQAAKYLFVWAGSLLLNATGVYFLTDVLSVRYWVSKIIVSLIVGICYNYVLQKIFVFKKPGYRRVF